MAQAESTRNTRLEPRLLPSDNSIPFLQLQGNSKESAAGLAARVRAAGMPNRDVRTAAIMYVP